MSYYNLISSMLKATISSLLTGLYAVYKAESNANDSLATYNGTAQGGLTYSTGKSGNSFQFNGTNAYVALPDNSLNLVGQISVSFWWYVDITNDQVFVGNRQKNIGLINHGWQLRYNSGAIIFRIMNLTTDTEWTASSIPISANTWVHIVAIKNSSSDFKLYVNNFELNMIGGASAEPAYLSNQKCTIGNVWTGSAFDSYMKSGSKIDELNIWNKALSTTERTELYNAGAGKFHPFT